MDEIYSNAYFTIIAAAGTTARDGLPGISGVSRIDQVEVKADGCTFLEILCVPDAIRSSTWATRAWTYQEGLLSKRCLIFTERGVLYRCADRRIDESVQRLVPKGTNAYMRHDYLPRLLRTDLHIGAIVDVREHILQYTQRHLTYPQDSLNAFLGVLRDHGRLDAPAPVKHIWGVPHREGKPQFAWYHQTPAVRRPDFPSWSWAGWAGGIKWGDLLNGPEIHGNSIFSPIFVEAPVQSPSLSPLRWPLDHQKHIYVTGAMIPIQLCTAERTEHMKNITEHLGHHTKALGSQVRARRPFALFEYLAGLHAAVHWFPDSAEDDLRDDLVGLLATQCFSLIRQEFAITNIIILKPVANHFERVGILNMGNIRYLHDCGSIYVDDAGSAIESPRLTWGIMGFGRPWFSQAERKRICLK